MSGLSDVQSNARRSYSVVVMVTEALLEGTDRKLDSLMAVVYVAQVCDACGRGCSVCVVVCSVVVCCGVWFNKWRGVFSVYQLRGNDKTISSDKSLCVSVRGSKIARCRCVVTLLSVCEVASSKTFFPVSDLGSRAPRIAR